MEEAAEEATFEQVSGIMGWFQGVFQKIKGIIRWNDEERYHKRNYFESVLEHTLSITTIALVLLDIEESGKLVPRVINPVNIMGYLLVHDHPEGFTKRGDVLYPDKYSDKDTLLKVRLDEELAARSIFLKSDLPDCVGNILFNHYTQAGMNDIEIEYCKAVECLGYVLYAMNEYFRFGHKDFIQVFRRQMPRLKNYAEPFISVRYFYNIIARKIEKII